MSDKSNKLGPFDHVDEIYMRQRPDYFDTLSTSDKKSYNQYMINRIISMNVHQLPYVNYIQMYPVPNECHYSFFRYIIPKKKQYNKY